ncbi:hypothetical protein BB560_007092 [Smittium megazygosporum]|uniref:Uncharacterized protein n=1 Tax=Smittium megazygosporum TaxID=133381 RepID=A0A2T9XYX5_9FUNG|nr:hypothetical protein BB560_007092 [Smittium megazygosporum]
MQSIERYDRGSSVVEYPARQLEHLPTDAEASRSKRTRICHYGCFWDWLVGITSDIMSLGGTWDSKMIMESYNYKEAATLLYALKLHAPYWKEQKVGMQTGNTMAKSIFMLGGTTASKKLLDLAKQWWDTVMEHRIRQDQQALGPFEDRPVRIGTEQETPAVLLTGTGPTITGDRCTNAFMAQEGGICQPTTDASTANTTTSNTRTATDGNSSAQLALTALVSSTTETSTGTTHGAEIRSLSMDNASMVRIEENEQGLKKEAIQLISESVKKWQYYLPWQHPDVHEVNCMEYTDRPYERPMIQRHCMYGAQTTKVSKQDQYG